MTHPVIKKILVPVDLTETTQAATFRAASIAKRLNAELLLVHVLAFNDYYFSVVPEMRTILPSIKEIEMAVKKQLDDLSKTINEKYGVKPEAFVTTGNIETEIVSLSKNKNADLIVMGTHGASGPKELFIGSNAQRVVTLSEIPVLTMRVVSGEMNFKNILIPIDNTLHSREKINLAMGLAELFQAKIRLLGLADTSDTSELNKLKIKLESVEKIIRAEKLDFVTTIANADYLSKEALNYAEKNNCDLIVINTGHESKITGVFLGPFAQQIVNHSKVPVLSIKPKHGNYDEVSRMEGSMNPFL